MRHNPKGEMPFLDHLEELRWRIFKGGAAFILAALAGFGTVHYLKVTQILIRPALPFLPDGKLSVFDPLTPFFFELKLAVIVGILISFPIILFQVRFHNVLCNNIGPTKSPGQTEGNQADAAPPAANVTLDSRGGSVAEVAITGCTLQHGSKAAASANIHIIGPGDDKRVPLGSREVIGPRLPQREEVANRHDGRRGDDLGQNAWLPQQREAATQIGRAHV